MDTKVGIESVPLFDAENFFIADDQEFFWPQFVPACTRRAAVGALLACSLSFTTLPFAMGDSYDASQHDFCREVSVPGTLEPISDFWSCAVAATQMELPSNIQNHLADFLHDANIPEQWKSEGIENPSPECYNASMELLTRNYQRFGILPSKVVATKSSTLYACYRNTRSGFTLRIEVDKDLDATAVVSNGKGLIEAGAFEDEFADRAVAILDGTART